jgi:hypothetical protein
MLLVYVLGIYFSKEVDEMRCLVIRTLLEESLTEVIDTLPRASGKLLQLSENRADRC